MLGHDYKLPLEPVSERPLETGDERKRITEAKPKIIGLRLSQRNPPLDFGLASESRHIDPKYESMVFYAIILWLSHSLPVLQALFSQYTTVL